jgi:hypothetical protein
MRYDRFYIDGVSIEVGIIPINSVTVSNNKFWIKISGTWKEAITWVKVSGVWKEATPYLKLGGVWK